MGFGEPFVTLVDSIGHVPPPSILSQHPRTREEYIADNENARNSV